MQFDQTRNNMPSNDDIRIKPKLIKKSNLSTQKTANESKVAPSNTSIGYDFSVDGQKSNNIEEKVAHLSLQMNQVIVRPYLQQALDYLKTSKSDSINAYNQLSDQIANEIRIISQNTQQISNALKEAQEVVAKTQEIIRNKYNNAIEEEISSGALNLDYEYNIVAENYELSLQLTQELSRYKSRIDSLLSTQSMLDESIVPAISRLQVEIDNLELLLQSFDSSSYVDILAKKTGKNISAKTMPTNDFRTRSEELNKMVAASSLNSLNTFEQNNVNLENMNRYESPNNQRINTSNYNMMNNQNQQFMNNMYGMNMSMNNNMSNSSMMNSNVQSNQDMNGFNYSVNGMNNNQSFMNGSFNNNFGNNGNFSQNFQFSNAEFTNDQKNALSRQELKLMKKLREQQMKFQHMMRMNEMIFEYNRSIDQMMLRQREYENAHREQFDEANRSYYNEFDKRMSGGRASNYPSDSKQIYETKMPLESLNDYVKKSNNDKIFVVRQADPVTPEKARELKNNGSVKTIKVVKKK